MRLLGSGREYTVWKGGSGPLFLCLFGGAFDEDKVWEPQVGFEARDQFGRLVNVAA